MVKELKNVKVPVFDAQAFLDSPDVARRVVECRRSQLNKRRAYLTLRQNTPRSGRRLSRLRVGLAGAASGLVALHCASSVILREVDNESDDRLVDDCRVVDRRTHSSFEVQFARSCHKLNCKFVGIQSSYPEYDLPA